MSLHDSYNFLVWRILKILRRKNIHMRSLPEEPHLAWVGATFSDFRHLSWAYFFCKWAKILICWYLNGQFLWPVYCSKVRLQHTKLSEQLRRDMRTWEVTQKKDKSWSQMRLLGGTPHMFSLWLYMLHVVLFSAKKQTLDNFYFMFAHLNHEVALAAYSTTWTAPMPSHSPNAPPLTVMNSRGEKGG